MNDIGERRHFDGHNRALALVLGIGPLLLAWLIYLTAPRPISDPKFEPDGRLTSTFGSPTAKRGVGRR